MKGSPRVRKLIADGNLPELHEEIERSVGYERMQSLNQSLTALVVNGVVSRERALAESPQPADLDLMLRKLLLPNQGGAAPEGDMAVSSADYSHILRLQEVQKAYDELQERYQRELTERDALIVRLEDELRGQNQAGSTVEGTVRALTEEKEKLARQIVFQKQELEGKIEKLQMRIRDLTSTPAGSGIYRR